MIRVYICVESRRISLLVSFYIHIHIYIYIYMICVSVLQEEGREKITCV